MLTSPPVADVKLNLLLIGLQVDDLDNQMLTLYVYDEDAL